MDLGSAQPTQRCSGECGRILMPRGSPLKSASQARVAARGMCMGCYQRSLRSGSFEPQQTPTHCDTCGRKMKARGSEEDADVAHESGGTCTACVRRKAREPETRAPHIGNRKVSAPDPENVFIENGRRMVNTAGAQQILNCPMETVWTLGRENQLMRIRPEGRFRYFYYEDDVIDVGTRGPHVARAAILLESSTP